MIREKIKEYNSKHGTTLTMGKIAILVYGERPIGEKSMQVMFSRLVNGKRKHINLWEIERLAGILDLSVDEIFEIFGKHNKN
jgi:hypothetical protein